MSAYGHGLLGPPRGSLTPETIKPGMRVTIHYALSPDATGTVVEVDEPWAVIRFDGYEGRLVERALISECDPC
jgi:hypothetical protein